MSYHILHISEYGSKLSKERGLLVCKKDGAVLGKIAIEDLRAVVIVAGGVSISGEVFSSILANDAIILHCKNYKPVGISVPNCRTYDARVVLNQSAGNKNLNAAIWRRLLCAKIENCAACLGGMDVKDSRLHEMAQGCRRGLNESLCAREYWKNYFPRLGEGGGNREPGSGASPINALLDYGYGIMGGIIHRSLIVSGLNSLLGVNHKTYYKNTPLVYDAIEPFRAFVDYALYKYACKFSEMGVRGWSIFFGKYLRDKRVGVRNGSVKLMDAADVMCESLANAYRYKKAELLWTPALET